METLILGSVNNICFGFLLELDLCIKITAKTILGLIWKTSNNSKVLDIGQITTHFSLITSTSRHNLAEKFQIHFVH